MRGHLSDWTDEIVLLSREVGNPLNNNTTFFIVGIPKIKKPEPSRIWGQ
jgi:hypothetical protein